MTIQNQKMRRRTHRRTHRRTKGILLIEMLVAMAFLVVAIGAVMKMHQTSLDYDRVTSDRLRHQLAVENVEQQLSSVAYAELSDAAAELAKETGAKMQVDPFEFESQQGVHITVQIESEGGPLTHHIWRLEPRS